MFGSLKINGEKVVSKISLKDAVPGFLMMTEVNFPNSHSKVGDLVLKTRGGTIINITQQYILGNDVDLTKYNVCYVDVDLNYKGVEV